ncbi:hypothetical protein WK94_31070 [Burkholderia ubonensis]|uniref:hypothetical protein n=1 Tax=Burkholderia ubonensis TaxID=101571 RepID=UPI000755C034|nr:hypothetical protein [Burkholderia ubonensis]KVW34129.1 hypothetical protein WK94_31070 [Burkholderia ubonensis]
MDDSTHPLAFEQLHEFTVPAAPAVPGRELEAWSNGARFALDAIARASLDPLKVALEACAAEEARCVAAQQLEPPAERDTLPDTVRAAIRTIDLQLDLIAARAGQARRQGTCRACADPPQGPPGTGGLGGARSGHGGT